MENLEFEHWSPGKLLITGEYVVLKGGLGLALPVRFGQRTKIFRDSGKKIIKWESLYNGRIWFEAEFSWENCKPISTNDNKRAEIISRILSYIFSERPGLLKNNSGIRFENILDFHPEMGLGSSSTLLYNLSKWSDTDAFQMNRLFFEGSGFDIAVASENAPILYCTNYNLPFYEKVYLNWTFKESLFFVYLGRKQSSYEAVKEFINSLEEDQFNTERYSLLTHRILNAGGIDLFAGLIEQHENEISKLIGKPKVQEYLFSDFKGTIKSLGAWGGDFILVVSPYNKQETQAYFNKKDCGTVYSWFDIFPDNV